ncbi:hypothetical protein [Pseudomonas chlororaphis]|uniref:hypothetical protein n=1 Tax=Pseudomonas chlororaphis TaxID=587753 RepID=UPI001E5A2FA0|nr:hypothetical protein [Pseudomonas chlororaphis]
MSRLLLVVNKVFFFFSESTQRTIALPKLILAAKRSAIEDFLILAVDYKGDNSDVIHPHGLYFGFSSPIIGASVERVQQIKAITSWDDELDDLDENFLCALMENVQLNEDSYEVGCPEKIASMESFHWSISVAERVGRYEKNASLISDEALIKEFKRVEGGANYYLYQTSSPRYSLSWEKFKEDARRVLLGNSAWSSVFDSIVSDVETNNSKATVSISVYNLADIVFSLANVFAKEDARFMPRLQLIVTYAEAVTVYTGYIVWSGREVRVEAEQWIRESFNSIEEYFIRRHFGEQFECDDEALRNINLVSIVAQVSKSGGREETSFLCVRNEKVVSLSVSNHSFYSVSDFCSRHRGFGIALSNCIAKVAPHWVG